MNHPSSGLSLTRVSCDLAAALVRMGQKTGEDDQVIPITQLDPQLYNTVPKLKLQVSTLCVCVCARACACVCVVLVCVRRGGGG